MYAIEYPNSALPITTQQKKTIIQSFGIYILLAFFTSITFGFGLQGFRLLCPLLQWKNSILNGAFFSLVLWIGFFVPFSVAKVIWQFKSWTVVGLEISYEFIRLAFMLTIFWTWN